MVHRFVSLLLLPCVLLTQSAAVFGHSHGGSQPAGHDLRPHFHTNPTSADHHGHRHPGPCGHHHSGPCGHPHHHEGDDLTEPDAQPAPKPVPLSEDEHDSDAVLLDSVDVVLTVRTATDDAYRASLSGAVSGADLPTLCCAGLPQQEVNWAHTPPWRGDACPLYLRQLTLRI